MKYSITVSGVKSFLGNSRFMTGVNSDTISPCSSRLNRFDTMPLKKEKLITIMER